jgi:Nuclease-related domain/Type III restriction enzyme, res subunit
MARMIPSIIDPECASEAERHVFQKLKNDPKADQWVVFHSLDIARHETRIKGESDFVIILPGRGVLCLEVKSYVRCAEGLWYYSPHGKPEVRSPFKQASEAMHSIRGQLIAKHPELETLVFWSAVVLPFVTFTAESIEWNNWQVIDQRSLSSQPLRDSLENVLVNGQRLLWESRAKWFKGDAAEPDSRQCKVLVDALRPDFEFYESPRARLDKIARDVKNYTEEQFRALDQMSLNERVVFEGPAGTGKSLLAMEAARRAKTSGRKTLFVCYNKILAKWLQVQTSGLGPLVTTRNLHDHMAHTLGVKLRDTTDDAYWKEELPSKTLEKLSDPDASNSRFDVLIIDEAQDIFSTNYLDVLDLSIEGGLAGGEWRIFGDFATQNIYGSSPYRVGKNSMKSGLRRREI